MNVPPPREIPKLRDQLAEYSATQRAQQQERKRRAVARMLRAEADARARAHAFQLAREATNQGQNPRQVIYQRPSWVRPPIGSRIDNDPDFGTTTRTG